MAFSLSELNYNSVEMLPGYESRVAFTVNSSSVFKVTGEAALLCREHVDIVQTIIDDKLAYIPWGGDNQMPFDIINLSEKDETLANSQLFNAEVCFGSGLRYDTCITTASVKSEVCRLPQRCDIAPLRGASPERDVSCTGAAVGCATLAPAYYCPRRYAAPLALNTGG